MKFAKRNASNRPIIHHPFNIPNPLRFGLGSKND